MRWPYGGHLLYRGHLWMSPGRRACPLRRYLGVYTFRSVAKLQPRHVQSAARRRAPADWSPRRGARAWLTVELFCHVSIVLQSFRAERDSRVSDRNRKSQH